MVGQVAASPQPFEKRGPRTREADPCSDPCGPRAGRSGRGCGPARAARASAAGRSLCLEPGGDGRRPRGGPVVPVGHVVLVVGVVGDVQVVVEVHRPAVQGAHELAHLGRVELRVVAVQVQVARGGAPARLRRSALVDPREGGEALVAVHVEDGHEQEVRAIEQRAFACPPTLRSRSSIMPASLPSISPAWMPAWAKSVGRPLARRASGVEGLSFDATTSQISRPPGLLPRLTISRPEEAATSFFSQLTVSS